MSFRMKQHDKKKDRAKPVFGMTRSLIHKGKSVSKFRSWTGMMFCINLVNGTHAFSLNILTGI